MRIAILDFVWHDSKPGGARRSYCLLAANRIKTPNTVRWFRLCYEYDEMLGCREGRDEVEIISQWLAIKEWSDERIQSHRAKCNFKRRLQAISIKYMHIDTEVYFSNTYNHSCEYKWLLACNRPSPAQLGSLFTPLLIPFFSQIFSQPTSSPSLTERFNGPRPFQPFQPALPEGSASCRSH